MYTYMSVGFSLGLSVSVACALVCLPILAPYVAAEHPTIRKGLYSSVLFTAGRLISYLILGLLVGLLATSFDAETSLMGPGLLAVGSMAILHGLVALGAFNMRLPVARSLCKYASSKRSPFYLGMLGGLRLCFPLIAALAYAITLPGVTEILLFMLAFWAGSSVLIFLVGPISGGLAGVIAKKISIQRVRRISGVALVFAGLLFITQGVGSII
jgi:sulfite exporter TauE/SafE